MSTTSNSVVSVHELCLSFSPLRCMVRELVLVIFVVCLTEAASSSLFVSVPANSLDEGAYANFYCLLTIDETAVTVKRWEFNGNQLFTSSHIRIKPSHTKHILQFLSTRQSDSGTYTCIAEINGVEVSASEHLRVYPPIVTYEMPLTRANVGDDVTLKCKGQHYDMIFWWRNGAMIQPGKQGYLRFSSTDRTTQESHLRITNVTKADNGTYRCEFISLRTADRTVELLVEDVIHTSTQAALSTVATASSKPSGHPTTLFITTQSPRSGDVRSHASSHNRTNGTVAMDDNTVSARSGFVTAASFVIQPTASTPSVSSKTQSEPLTVSVINATTKPAEQKDISNDYNATIASFCIEPRREETPTWTLVVIAIGFLCGFLGGSFVCANFLLKHFCSWRSPTDLSDEQTGKANTLQHPETERHWKQSRRNVPVHLYDVARLYETADGVKTEEVGVFPTFRSSTSVDRDSRGYVTMKDCRRFAETKGALGNTNVKSDHDTNAALQTSESKTSVTEMTDSYQPRLDAETSRYVNTVARQAEQLPRKC